MTGEKKRRTSVCIKGRLCEMCNLEIPDWMRSGAKYCGRACATAKNVEVNRQRRFNKKLEGKYNVD